MQMQARKERRHKPKQPRFKTKVNKRRFELQPRREAKNAAYRNGAGRMPLDAQVSTSLCMHAHTAAAVLVAAPVPHMARCVRVLSAGQIPDDQRPLDPPACGAAARAAAAAYPWVGGVGW